MLSLMNAIGTPLYSLRSCVGVLAAAVPFLFVGVAAAEGPAQASSEPPLTAAPRISKSPVFEFEAGSRYGVTSSTFHVTDIALQRGEELVGEVAIGDSVRWVIAVDRKDRDRVHVLLKPTKADLSTNLIVRTTRRTYLLELQSVQADASYMMTVGWTYPKVESSSVVGAADASNNHY